MELSLKRVARSLLIAAVVVPTLAACAVVGGGGTVETDCDSDVSGSEFTPVATGQYDVPGVACNNNEFVDTDFDAYAYPAADSDLAVAVTCKGDGRWQLFDVTSGFPTLVDGDNCDGGTQTSDNDPGNRYVLVIEHSLNGQGVEFEVFTANF